MTDEQKQQIAGEIDNQGLDYWIQNYGASSLKENNAPQELIDIIDKADKALTEAENALEAAGFLGE